ncbi:hypothetical protein D0867_04891 [Hortaea werneckii]|uniref:C2H2-type domain-containing protein n=1 Tax=Hortaea werneckii TaxID=91943 RepID=A0A3M6ZV10_HORWE|nr:hypothetical protein D0867_04891 [Hortaea werneckii]
MAATTRATTPQNDPFRQVENPHTPASQPASGNGTRSGEQSAQSLQPVSVRRHRITPENISPKSDKPGFSPATNAVPLTGQAAMAELKRRKLQQDIPEARQTSQNPAVDAMQSLMGGGGMSRPSDAPAPEKLSEPMRKAAERIQITDNAHNESVEPSPTSIGSFASTIEGQGGASAMTATSGNTEHGPQYVAEPGQIDDDGHLGVGGEEGAKAYSYPGPPPPQDHDHEGALRGTSYPGIHGSPKSPASNKRHKCPYCSTDFTRHHNLKSHLLTHSQEKPYVCQTCQARFRRLHDLKRHTKLHTGERPHTCDKCGRKFARGDALARHNKGPGGCAGRRSSFGDDGAMDGVEYTGGEDDEDEVDAQARRVSEPSRKRAHFESAHDPSRQVYRQHSSTYPPVGPGQGRPHASSIGNMAPPQVIHPGSNPTSSPREISGHMSDVGASTLNSSYYPPGQVFQQQQGGVMTESPKPLSLGQPADQHRLSVDAATMGARNRSPSLTTQFQQQHFGRGSRRGTPPQPAGQLQPGQQVSHAPVLPPIPAGQPQSRPGFQPSIPGAHGPSSLQHGQLPPTSAGSQPGSLSSHGRSSGSSIRDALGASGQDPNDIWSYVRSLEQRFGRMQDEYELRISRLQEEVISLKGQMAQNQAAAAASYSSDMGQRPY